MAYLYAAPPMYQQFEIFYYNALNTGILDIYWIISIIVDSGSCIWKYNLQTWKMIFR